MPHAGAIELGDKWQKQAENTKAPRCRHPTAALGGVMTEHGMMQLQRYSAGEKISRATNRLARRHGSDVLNRRARP
jgi:hypothetical protein